MSVTVKYTAHATATGGRDGRATTPDGEIDLKLTTPKELGGAGGEGANPEQLFASGYSACFLGALKLVASQKKVKLPDSTKIDGEVGIGPRDEGGFGITAKLTIHLDGLDREVGENLIEEAHKVCPYSNATRGNVDVELVLA